MRGEDNYAQKTQMKNEDKDTHLNTCSFHAFIAMCELFLKHPAKCESCIVHFSPKRKVVSFYGSILIQLGKIELIVNFNPKDKVSYHIKENESIK